MYGSSKTVWNVLNEKFGGELEKIVKAGYIVVLSVGAELSVGIYGPKDEIVIDDIVSELRGGAFVYIFKDNNGEIVGRTFFFDPTEFDDWYEAQEELDVIVEEIRGYIRS